MAKKRRIKKKVKRLITLVIVIIVLVIGGIVGTNIYNDYKYKQTFEYKLLEKEYKIDEVNILLNKLKDNEIEDILNRDYINNLSNIVNEKYFLYKNLDRYITYYKKDPGVSLSNIISLVNTNRDGEYYGDTKNADTSKDILVLVNKYYFLDEDYEPSNLTNISSTYAFEGNILREDVFEHYKAMYNEAKAHDINLVINSSYRTFKDQENVWTARKNAYGTKSADSYAARPGFSEHQTGLALDINEYPTSESDFENTDSFKWLQEHAHEYGFILRYPKSTDDKPYEDITGYSYESWHYRYVGKDIATKIKNENITFDEYYAFYLE